MRQYRRKDPCGPSRQCMKIISHSVTVMILLLFFILKLGITIHSHCVENVLKNHSFYVSGRVNHDKMVICGWTIPAVWSSWVNAAHQVNHQHIWFILRVEMMRSFSWLIRSVCSGRQSRVVQLIACAAAGDGAVKEQSYLTQAIQP